LEKIKEFAIANKIFQANKIIFPLEQLNKGIKEQSFHTPSNNQQINVNTNDSFNLNKT